MTRQAIERKVAAHATREVYSEATPRVGLYVSGGVALGSRPNCMTLTQPQTNRPLHHGTKSPQAPDGDWWDGLIDGSPSSVALTEEEISCAGPGECRQIKPLPFWYGRRREPSLPFKTLHCLMEHSSKWPFT